MNRETTEKMQKLKYIDPETNKTGIACVTGIKHFLRKTVAALRQEKREKTARFIELRM